LCLTSRRASDTFCSVFLFTRQQFFIACPAPMVGGIVPCVAHFIVPFIGHQTANRLRFIAFIPVPYRITIKALFAPYQLRKCVPWRNFLIEIWLKPIQRIVFYPRAKGQCHLVKESIFNWNLHWNTN